MAQKINPISLRLGKTNRSFDSSWFNDSNYGNLVMKNLKIQWYINSVLKKIQYCSARYTIQNLPNKTKINVFFCASPCFQLPSKMVKIKNRKTRLNSFFFQKKPLHNYKETNSKITTFLPKINKDILFKPLYVKKFPNVVKNLNKSLFKKFAVKHSATDTQFLVNGKINFYFYTENKIINKNFSSKIENSSKCELNFIVDFLCTIKKLQNFYIKYFLIKHFSILKNKVTGSVSILFNTVSLGKKSSFSFAPTNLKKVEIQFFQKFENTINFLFLKIYKNKNKLYLNNLKLKLDNYKSIYYKKKIKKKMRIFKLRENPNPINYSIFHQSAADLLQLPSYFVCQHSRLGFEKRKKLFFTLKLKKKKINNILNFFNNLFSVFQYSNTFINEKTKNARANLDVFKNYYNFSLLNNQNYNNIYKNLFKYFNYKLNTIFRNKYSNALNLNSFFILAKQKSKRNLTLINTPYKNHIESVISKSFSCNTSINFFKTTNVLQSATFFIDEIIYYLEKKVPFFKIRNYILTKLTEKNNFRIKGMRIVISGRIGGKSKKAQRSKIQNFKYGQTSLHVFSSKIDFQKKNAITSFGTLGVKLWICYL